MKCNARKFGYVAFLLGALIAGTDTAEQVPRAGPKQRDRSGQPDNSAPVHRRIETQTGAGLTTRSSRGGLTPAATRSGPASTPAQYTEAWLVTRINGVADSNDPALLLKRRDGHVLAPPAMIEKWRMTEPAGDGVVFNNGWSQGSSATPMMVRPEVLHGKVHEIDAVGAGGVESAFVMGLELPADCAGAGSFALDVVS